MSSNKKFGLTLAIFFAILGVWKGIRVFPLSLSVIFVFLSIAFPNLLTRLNKGWTKIGLILHAITSPVILALIFFGVISPFGILMRLLKQRPLTMGFNKKLFSYWKPSELSRFEDQF